VLPWLKSSVVLMCDPIKNSRLQFVEHASQWSAVSVMCRSSEGGAKVLELQWRVRSVAKQPQKVGASNSKSALGLDLETTTTSPSALGYTCDKVSSPNMGFLTRLYRAETLDTRFAPKTGQRLPDARPSKWNTPEYYLYYLCFLTIPFMMVKSVYDVSGPWHASYKQYEHLLEPGWIPGRKVDNSDAQYRGFRENIPYMAMVVVLHPILRRVYERFTVSLS